jgi:uncharacterized protein
MAMKKAALREARRRSNSKNPPFNYRWEHVKAVVNTAVKLAPLVGADVEVVEAAAWLHDIKKETGLQHPKKGARFARKFLPATDFPDEKIEAVAQAIEEHMGLSRSKPLKQLESQVLWDADKLTKLGAMAAFHWLGGDLSADKQRNTQDLIALMRSADWQQKTVNSMHTEPAKRAAQARFQDFQLLADMLEQEYKATDIVPNGN